MIKFMEDKNDIIENRLCLKIENTMVNKNKETISLSKPEDTTSSRPIQQIILKKPRGHKVNSSLQKF
jgi:hypothetical protein